jgi:hypothetical protein
MHEILSLNNSWNKFIFVYRVCLLYGMSGWSSYWTNSVLLSTGEASKHLYTEISLAFYGTKRFITVISSIIHCFFLSHMYPLHTTQFM